MEISLVKAFGWSLRDIDETEVESLMDFIDRFTGGSGEIESGIYVNEF
jgi:hypothetical protein